MEEIDIRCTHCNINVSLKTSSTSIGLIYSGICSNSKCPDPKKYVCRPCYDFPMVNITMVNTHSPKGRKAAHFNSMKSLKQHVKNKVSHQKSLVEYEKSKRTNDDNDNYDNNIVISNDNDTISLSILDSNITTLPSSNFTSSNNYGTFDPQSKSTKYYKYESKFPGHGPKYLIGNAFHKREVDYEKISEDEVIFFLKLSSLLTQLTKPQQQLLADIMLAATNSKDESLSIFGDHTKVPTSMYDFEQIILSKERSIITNLPHPTVKLTDDGTHAYVSLIDLLSNELAADTIFDTYSFENNDPSNSTEFEINDKNLTTISKSTAAKKMYWKLYEPINDGDNHIMYLWLKEWRDAFDPNSTKSSRNQVWIQTFTISPPEFSTSGKNTYLMSISGKSEDHSVVDHIYGKEIEHLSTNGQIFYHGGTNKMIKVKLGKLIICVDRPERVSMFHAGDHAGKYSAMWGNAGEVDGQMKNNYLPSCVECRSKRIMEYFDDGMTYDNHNDCESKIKCCGWNVFHNNFYFPIPDGYPTINDCSVNAPDPPKSREIIHKKITEIVESQQIHKKPKTGDKQQLKMSKLSVSWLKNVCDFAYHNITTKNMDLKSKKPYWNKTNCNAFLKTCGLSSDIIQEICMYSNPEHNIPFEFPALWQDDLGFEKCHYAGMHMLFLGHVKSNFDMLTIWLSKQSLLAPFGKQANLYFNFVKTMRVSKYFSPQNLSTSTWGTGSWVSENYLFYARTQKFFIILPALTKSRLKQRLDIDYIIDYRTILRFITSANAMMSRIMSSKEIVPDMDCMIKLYMDCMVEMDTNILKYATSETLFWEADDTNDDEVVKKYKRPNFVKGNSLGILAVAKAHELFGPLLINWEGGFEGERKIQEVKPLLSIKRENADWEKISLKAHYQLETLTNLLETVQSSNNESQKFKQNRENSGTIKIFGKKEKAEEAVRMCCPLSGIVDDNNNVWIAYRPTGVETTRSYITLVQLEFDDNNGINVEGICWMAPIELTENVKEYKSMEECCNSATQFALLLPKLTDDGLHFSNMYYAIGHKWTERNTLGVFEWSDLSFDHVFKDWSTISTETASL